MSVCVHDASKLLMSTTDIRRGRFHPLLVHLKNDSLVQYVVRFSTQYTGTRDWCKKSLLRYSVQLVLLVLNFFCPQPAHNDKTAHPEVARLMKELIKSRKQLKGLYIIMFTHIHEWIIAEMGDVFRSLLTVTQEDSLNSPAESKVCRICSITSCLEASPGQAGFWKCWRYLIYNGLVIDRKQNKIISREMINK